MNIHDRLIFMFTLCLACFFVFEGGVEKSAWAQNVTPRVTPFSTSNTESPGPTPTPIWRLDTVVKRVSGARLELIAGDRVIFSELSADSNANVPVYYWEPGADALLETGELAVPGSVIADEAGQFMVFLFNETDPLTGRDINGDGARASFVLRLYHFETRQKINIGIPAQTYDNDFVSNRGRFHERFEYQLTGDNLVFPVSDTPSNSQIDLDARWYIFSIQDLMTHIVGTPTPAPTPTPTPTPTPASPPTPAPTPTPNESLRADINLDGRIDALDLLILQRYWLRSADPVQ